MKYNYCGDFEEVDCEVQSWHVQLGMPSCEIKFTFDVYYTGIEKIHYSVICTYYIYVR